MKTHLTLLAGLLLALSSSCSGCGEDADLSTPLEVIAPKTSLSNVLPPRTTEVISEPKYSVGNFASLTVPNDAGKQEPLTVESLEVDVQVVGRMARTQVTQVFHNHTPRRTEGVYEFTLPEGAAISRLAMDVNGTIVEGEIVEKKRARKIYDEIVASMKDPALLEWQGGNRFKTSIFPIEPRSDKKIILTYEQMLPTSLGEARYRYTMPKLEKDTEATPMKKFAFRLLADRAGKPEVVGYESKVDGKVTTVTAKDFLPSGPLDVVFRGGTGDDERVFNASRDDEQFFLADVVLDLPQQQAGAERSLVIALDRSASIGQRELDRAKALVGELAAGVGNDARVQIVHGNVDVQRCFNRGATGTEAKDATNRCLDGLDASGASDLGALLVEAGKVAVEMKRPTSVILVSEGTASVGELDGELIAANFAETVSGSDVTLHTVAIGPTPNGDGLASLAASGGGHFTHLLPTDVVAGVAETVRALARQSLVRNVKVTVADGTVHGLSTNAGQGTTNLARGQGLAVMGKLVTRRALIDVTGTFEGKPVTKSVELTATTAEGPLVVRNFWARRNIDNLLAEGRDREEVVGFSKRYGVMSPYTSFLVLENDAAFKKYQIERKKDAERQREATRTGTKNLEKGKDSLQNLLDGIKSKSDKTLGEAEPADDRGEDTLGDDDEADDNVEGFFKEREKAEVAPAETATPEPALIPTGEEEQPPRAAKPRSRRPAPRGPGRADNKLLDLGGSGSAKGWAGKKAYLPRTPPSVRFDDPVVIGNLDKGVVNRVVRQNGRRFRQCYEEEARQQLASEGRVVVKFTVGVTGVIQKVEVVSSKTQNAVVDGCIRSTLRRLRFPSVDGIVVVTQSMTFDSGDLPPRRVPADKLIADLAARGDQLDLGSARRLIKLYLSADQRQEAARFIDAWSSKQNPSGDPAIVQLLNSANMREAFADKWLPAIERLARADRTGIYARPLFDYLEDNGRYDEIVAKLGVLYMPPHNAGQLLAQLTPKQVETARALLAAWRKNEVYSADELASVLDDRRLRGPLADQRFDVLVAMLEAGDDRIITIKRVKEAGQELGKGDEARAALMNHCKSKTANVLYCRRWFDEEKNSRPQLADLAQELRPTWLASLNNRRADDVANPEIISTMAELLEDMGHEAEAVVLLSEIVEYSPHDYGRRVRYARALVERGKPLDACHTYAVAVQLDPSQRDTFKTMMQLRRDHEKDAEALKKCIVKGVSNLPVKRDLSIVLTWEDPKVDVDLHIHEVGGHEVFYRRRNSPNGGFLYYDILDGYGPEIYALGEAPKGEYRLTLVYYGGESKNVKAKVTVLKNAGSKDEVREVKEIVLPESNTEKEYPVTTLSL